MGVKRRALDVPTKAELLEIGRCSGGQVATVVRMHASEQVGPQ